jgi:hypothetical protein
VQVAGQTRPGVLAEQILNARDTVSQCLKRRTDNCELITTESHDEGRVVEGRAQQGRHDHEDAIADGMTVRIVDFFEPVEVQADDATHLKCRRLAERASVMQSRERVAFRSFTPLASRRLCVLQLALEALHLLSKVVVFLGKRCSGAVTRASRGALAIGSNRANTRCEAMLCHATSVADAASVRQ